MSEQLPYNDEQWNELPIPDGETSWQKMELLLDKDKERRVPFWWWRYAALAVLVIGLASGGWSWLRVDDNKTESTRTVNENITVPKTETKDIIVPTEKGEVKNPQTNSTTRQNNTAAINTSEEKVVVTKSTEVSKQKGDEINNLVRTGKNKKASEKIKTKAPSITKTPSKNKGAKDLSIEKGKTNPLIVSNNKKNNSADILLLDKEAKKDSVKAKDSVSKIISPPVVSNDDKKDEKKKKSSLVWSAGVGLQQSIAVNGQQSSSFNYNGKKSSLGDRIPSIYLRLQKDKWFAQAEFQYAVPQPVENFYFSQKTKYDVANLNLNTERFTIQKLYYHQLPLSISYHLHKNLSVGVGGMYNILAGAVTQQEITSKNVQTGNETITRNLAPVKGFKDSFLYRTTAGILLQTDYHWKRFSLGLRYTQNLQPFIKYTRPDGTVLDEKTQALQAIVRFRMWQAK